MSGIYNKTEAAKVLKISVESINRSMKNGKLPYHKIGESVRFTESDLVTFLENCAIPATVTTTREKWQMVKVAKEGA